jgi:hypothetical protein
VQQADPVVGIAIIRAVPNKAIVSAVRKEKCRPVEAVLGAKILDLLVRRGLARITVAGSPGTISIRNVTSDTTVQMTSSIRPSCRNTLSSLYFRLPPPFSCDIANVQPEE